MGADCSWWGNSYPKRSLRPWSKTNDWTYVYICRHLRHVHMYPWWLACMKQLLIPLSRGGGWWCVQDSSSERGLRCGCGVWVPVPAAPTPPRQLPVLTYYLIVILLVIKRMFFTMKGYRHQALPGSRAKLTGIRGEKPRTRISGKSLCSNTTQRWQTHRTNVKGRNFPIFFEKYVSN